MAKLGKKATPYLQKSAYLKKISRKIDEVSQNLILNNDESVLEVIVEDSVNKNTQTRDITKAYTHTLATRGNYIKEDTRNAFQRIYYKTHWRESLSLANDYANAIAKGLDLLKYKSEVSGNKIYINSAVTKKEIIESIKKYIQKKSQKKRGWLTQGEFSELTGASEHSLVECFGGEHDTITNRQYSVNDVVRFSREFFKRSVPKNGALRGVSYDTVYNYDAHILNIYKKVLAKINPPKEKNEKPNTLF